MQAPLVPVTLAFLSGILLGTVARLPPGSLIVVGVVSTCTALWRWRHAQPGVIALLLLWMCLGALRMTVWERHPDMRLKEILSDEPQPVQLHGLVVDDPVELFEAGEPASGIRYPLTSVERKTVSDTGRVQVCVVALRHRQTAQGPSTACLDFARHSPERAIASRGTLRVSPHHTSDEVGLHWQPIGCLPRSSSYAVGGSDSSENTSVPEIRVYSWVCSWASARRSTRNFGKPFKRPGRFRFWRGNARNSIEVHLQSTLPYKRQRVKKLSARHTNYTTVYFSLTAEQAGTLREAAKKAVVSESEALRRILDAYLAEVDKRGLPSEPYGKMRFLGYEERVVPRTIRREQDSRLRELSERTGRSISELVREAVEG